MSKARENWKVELWRKYLARGLQHLVTRGGSRHCAKGGGREAVFLSLALPAFLSSAIPFFFFTQNKGGALDPPLVTDFFPHHHYPVMYSIDITGAFASWQGFIQGHVCSNG